MANETSKQMLRRSSDQRFSNRWVVGNGIDIGCGPDPLSNLADFFPRMGTVRGWDLPDGDAMLMDGVADASYDFVHSSHCLEHLADPVAALGNWIRICKPGGHLIITIPDEDLYEQGVWPSTFNEDHKWTFTILKQASWSPRSINVVQLLARFAGEVEILKLEKLDATFFYNRPRYDQTLHGLAESAIEIVLRRRSPPQEEPLRSDGEAHFATALKHHQEGRLAEALESYKATLAADPEHAPALNNLATLFSGETQENLLRQAIAVRPDYADALLNLGALLASNGRYEEARDVYQRTLAILPNDWRTLTGLCEAYERLGDENAAITLLESRVAVLDRADQAYCLLGKYCEGANRTDDAMRYLAKAIEINPDLAEAHILIGRQYWKRGDYAAGAREISWIWHERAPEMRRQIGLFTDEAGLPIRQNGRTVVISADSGLGDMLQFARFVQPIKDLGAQVIVECQPELVRLLRHAPGVDAAVPLGELIDRGDVRIPLHNLIGAFRAEPGNLPGSVPYLRVHEHEVAAWRERLACLNSGLRVGLCWSGNPSHWRNRSRSIPAEQMVALLGVPGVTYVSLQKDAPVALPGVVDWSSEFVDMATTAALVENLDLVITVDSAIAHLAGALGRPVWLLNRFDGCWRWLEARTDSPWYPDMTQFRQPHAGNWLDVISAARARLENLVESASVL